MAREMPWFRMWASETLQSRDLGALSPVEQMTWFRLLCVAAMEEPRGVTRIDAHLAAQCMVTPAQLSKALKKMAALGMVEVHDGTVIISNWAKYNPPRKPSDAPEETAERQRRSRANRRDSHADVTRDKGVTPGVTSIGLDSPSRVTAGVTPSRASACAVAEESREEILLLAQEEDDSSRARREFEPDPELTAAMRGIEGLGIAITPFVAEEVRAYLDEGVPGDWIRLACQRAAGNNVRSWNYVRPILADWQRNGGPPEVSDGRDTRGRIPGGGRAAAGAAGARSGAGRAGAADEYSPAALRARGLLE